MNRGLPAIAWPALIAGATLCALAIGRHWSGQSQFFDLGVMDNIVWQTAHGRLFWYPQYHMSYFGDHFAPILFAFVPLYWIWPSPLVLLIGQSVALVAGGLFVYRIAERALPDQPERCWLSGALAALYWLSPAVLHVALFDFHPVAFMIPLSLAAFDCYLSGKRRWMLACLVLLLACQEEAAITVAAFGGYLALFGKSRRERVEGLAVAAVATAYFFAVMKLVIPAFQPPGAAGWAYFSRYEHLGANLGELVAAVLLHPIDSFARSYEPYKLQTLGYLFLPLALLPLLGWRALLVAAPCLAYTYLSNRATQFVIFNQYFSPALGWLFAATATGYGAWAGLAGRFARGMAWRRLALSAPPLLVAFGFTLQADYKYSVFKPEYFIPHPYAAELPELERLIGPARSLAATGRLAPSFAHREGYYLALDFNINRELNAALHLPDFHDADFQLFELTRMSYSQAREQRVLALMRDEGYGVTYYRFPLVLFQRGAARRAVPELERLLAEVASDDGWAKRTFPAVLLDVPDTNAVTRQLPTAESDSALRFRPGWGASTFGPGIDVPAGKYEADFYLRLHTPRPQPAALIVAVSNFRNRIHNGRYVESSQFGGEKSFKPFTLAFTLERETRGLELHTHSLGADISLQKVVLRRLGPP